MTVKEIEKLVKETKKVKKGWFQRLANELKKKGLNVSEYEICSNGHHSGDVRKKGNLIEVFSWGRGVKARSGFNYNVYPVIAIEI